jgi:hypothetical protein
MSHIQRGQGFHRLDEIATHTLGPRVFGTCRWIRREKGCVVSVVVCRFDPVDGLRETENDPNCALCDRDGGVGPLGLHQPL